MRTPSQYVGCIEQWYLWNSIQSWIKKIQKNLWFVSVLLLKVFRKIKENGVVRIGTLHNFPIASFR